MSTHNVCFGSKVRKLGKPLQTPGFCCCFFFYIKVGFTGVYIARTCFPDVTVCVYTAASDYSLTEPKAHEELTVWYSSRCVRAITFSKIFFFVTAWPIKAKFYTSKNCSGTEQRIKRWQTKRYDQRW